MADEPAATTEGTPEATPAAAEAEEAEAPISWTIEVDLASSYVWRGLMLSSNLLQPVIQPFGEISFNNLGPGSLTLGLWMNKALTHDMEDTAWEFDPYVSYSFSVTKIDFKVGYIGYLYPDHPEGTKLDQGHEILGQITYNLDLPVTPYLAIYVEPVRQKGFYGAVGVTHSATLGKIDIASSLNLGVSMYKFEDGDEDDLDFGLQDITVQSRGTYAIGESGLYTALTVAIAYAGRDPGKFADGDDRPRILPYGILAIGFSK